MCDVVFGLHEHSPPVDAAEERIRKADGTFGTQADGGGMLTTGDVRFPVLVNCSHLYGVQSVTSTAFVYEFPTP